MGVWDESEYVAAEAKHRITSKTTNDEIDTYLVEARAMAAGDGVVLQGDARDYLIQIRDQKAEDEAS